MSDVDMNASIDVLGLPTRIRNRIFQAGASTLNDLVEMTPIELLRMPGLGRVGLAKVELALKGLGLSLSPNHMMKPDPELPYEREVKKLRVDNRKLHHDSEWVRYENERLRASIERLREALWQCGFWARNGYADDRTARLKIAHEAERALPPEYWAFKRSDDLEDKWDDA